MDPEVPPVAPADLNAPTPITSGSDAASTTSPPTSATGTAPVHPIPTGTPILTPAQQASAKSAAAGVAGSFKNVGQPGATSNAFNAIYGTGQLSGQPSLSGGSPSSMAPTNQPALNPIAQPSALGAVPQANTQINAVNAGMVQTPNAAISDRRAKTNIQSAKKDVYSFLKYLNQGQK